MIQCKLRSEALKQAGDLLDLLNKTKPKFYRIQICDYAFEVRIIDIENNIAVILAYVFDDHLSERTEIL